jgi:2-dehydropantoate 2-reductase
MPSILLIGAGAVGAFFGSALARAGAEVSVVCRSDFAAVARDGFEIRSPLLGEHRFVPRRVFASAAEAGRGFDYVLLATKVLADLDRAALIAPAVGDQTTIFLIQNGIDIEAELAAAFPHNPIVSGIAFIAVSRTGAGKIHHQSEGSLVIGNYPSGTSAATEQLAALFAASSIPCKVTQDVVTARWQKALWNAAFNPLSIMGGVLDTATILGRAEGEALVRETMAEIVSVACAAGHPLDEALIDKLIAVTRKMPPYKTSMALDYEQGRPLEIEAILGNIVRTARRCNVRAPRLETLYAIAKMVEGARRPAASK